MTPETVTSRLGDLAVFLEEERGLWPIDYVRPVGWLLLVKLHSERNTVFGQWRRIAQAPPRRMDTEIKRVLHAFGPQAHRPPNQHQAAFKGAFNAFGDNVSPSSTVARVVALIDAVRWTDTTPGLTEDLIAVLTQEPTT